MMKLCVYAICKNEINLIKQWVDRVSEADCVVVLDTGSTDGTWELLKSQKGIICEQKIFNPWRFDVARNEALKLVPQDCDICLPLDIDQIVIKGFSEAIKNSWEEGLSILRIPQYFKAVNKMGQWFAHTRNNCYWKYPVWEQIKSTSGVESHSKCTTITHDYTTNSQTYKLYLQLAELGIKENKNDPYCYMVKYKLNKKGI